MPELSFDGNSLNLPVARAQTDAEYMPLTDDLILKDPINLSEPFHE